MLKQSLCVQKRLLPSFGILVGLCLLSMGTFGCVEFSSSVQVKQNTTSAGQVNQALRQTLLDMLNADVKGRNEIGAVETMRLSSDEKAKKLSVFWARQNEIDQRNIKTLEGIVAKYGWPGRSIVGDDGSMAAFVIVQHAGLAQEKKFLPLLKIAVQKKEADRDSLPLLEDRVRLFEGKKQVYGTQLYQNPKTKKTEIWPIDNETEVDVRRASVGMEPLTVYAKRFGLTYKPPQKPPPCEPCKQSL